MKLRKNSFIITGGLAVALVAGTAWWQSQAAKSVPISEVSHIHGIAVDRADSARLYLATHYGVYQTSPDGTAERVSDNSSDYMGFTPHPTESELFYASGHPASGGNMGVLVSRDGGRTWEKLAAGAGEAVDFHAMAVSPADPNVIYGLYGDVQVSRDGGKTWETAGLQRQPATMVETAPDGSIFAFAVGSGLMKAPAAALAWQPVANSFGERVLLHLAIAPGNQSRMFAVTREGEILTSTDGGVNWAPLSS